MTTIRIKLPYDKVSLVNFLHEEGEIIDEKYSAENVFVEAKVNKILVNKLDRFKLNSSLE